MGIFDNRDNRPAKCEWAPGNYYDICSKCSDQFIGAKEAKECAKCAYSSNEKIIDISKEL